MLGITNYGAFLAAGIILNITPGADTMYILSRSMSSGKKAGILSVLGISSGSVIHTILAALGLSTILARSATAFNTIKYLGVIYLIFLGLTAIFKKEESTLNFSAEKLSLRKVYYQGLLTNLLNPKVALFFLAFLPQFVDPGSRLGALPFIFLGATFITTGTIWCLLLAIFSSLATQRIRKSSRISVLLKKLSGLVYLALGLKLLQAKVQN